MTGRATIALRLAGVALITALPVAARAQVQTNSTTTPLGRALMAERNGSYADAAVQYQAILRDQPANVGALIGMEHVLPRLDRGGELVPIVETALAADSSSIGVLQVAVRTFARSGHADSARKYVERWAAHSPHDEDPYREWSDAAAEVRDVTQARVALDVGRQQLGPTSLGLERAELFRRSGDLAAAIREWVPVVRATPVFREGAIGVFAPLAPAQRAVVREALQQDGSREARQMLGLLLAAWGEPTAGAEMLRGALPQDSSGALPLLRELNLQLRGRDDRPSRTASAATLEAIAGYESGPAAVNTLMDAARAYADAGSERDARRVLGLAAANPAAPGGMASSASATLLGVLIAEGNGAAAEKTLSQLGDKVTPDEHDRLARRVAMIWIRAGDFDRAERLVDADSSTDGFDLRGRIRLYRGDLAGANDLLKEAGPYDEAREQALERVTLLTLIQAVGRDSLPAFGQALLALERGDSARAVAALGAVAATLKPAGAAATRLLAGEVALARRDTATAVHLLHDASVPIAPAIAAAARLDLARIDVAAGKGDAAKQALEQLIIDYPESAVVPEARRLRDSLVHATPGGP